MLSKSKEIEAVVVHTATEVAMANQSSDPWH